MRIDFFVLPRHSLWLIAASSRCRSEMFGSSSHAAGTSPVQIVPPGTWFSGVRSCSGHSGICLASYSSKFDASAFWLHSGRASHAILRCRSPCLPGVASLYFTVPRNRTHRFGCFLTVAVITPCTSARPHVRVFWPHGVAFLLRGEWGRLGLWLGFWSGRGYFGC